MNWSVGLYDICTARKQRSGCGIMMVARPSVVVKPVAPSGEPFGLAGYNSVGSAFLNYKRLERHESRGWLLL